MQFKIARHCNYFLLPAVQWQQRFSPFRQGWAVIFWFGNRGLVIAEDDDEGA